MPFDFRNDFERGDCVSTFKIIPLLSNPMLLCPVWSR
jgi:hypothetical protein